MSSIKPNCEKKCRKDCSYTYYFNEFKTLTGTKNQVKITLQHNSMPDIVIKYLSQTTFLSIICNFGGLLGMWLGLSFVNILNQLARTFKQIKNSNHFNNNNINNDVNIFVSVANPLRGRLFLRNNRFQLNTF